MKYFISFIFMTILASSVSAYDGLPKDQVDMFFKDFSTDINKSIDNLYASNPAMQQKIQSLTVMKTQLTSAQTIFGKFLGYEPIRQEDISPSLVRITAIAKYELHPVSWEFYFYKPTGKWIVSQATFGDQFQYIGSKK